MINDDLSTIDAQRARWIEAINRQSAEGFVSVITDDAVWLASRSDAVSGRAAIREWLQAPFAAFRYDYSVSDVRVRQARDWAVEQARFRTRLTDEDGRELPVHEGRYLVLWRRSGEGTWLIERYVDMGE